MVPAAPGLIAPNPVISPSCVGGTGAGFGEVYLLHETLCALIPNIRFDLVREEENKKLPVLHPPPLPLLGFANFEFYILLGVF